jgi:hypothetical protein
MSVERPTGGPATVNPRSTVHHRACHHAPRTHRLGCRRGSGATCYMLTVPVREAAVHQMWTPGEAWVTALAECPRICFPFRSSWADARAQTAAECPGRAHWSSDSDAFTSGGIAAAVLRTGRCCTGSHRGSDPGRRMPVHVRAVRRAHSQGPRVVRTGAWLVGAAAGMALSRPERCCCPIHPCSNGCSCIQRRNPPATKGGVRPAVRRVRRTGRAS